MQILPRYFIKIMFVNAAVVTVALTAAIWLTQTLRFVDLIVNRGLSVGMFLELVALMLPRFLTIILPIGVFVGVLSAYWKLQSDSELVIFRAAGLPKISLAKPAIMFGVGAMILGYALTLWVLPLSFRAFKELEYDIRNNYGTFLLQEGVFNTLGDHLTIYVYQRHQNGKLEGVLIHDVQDAKRPVTVTAREGVLVSTPKGPSIEMFDGQRQEVDYKTNRISLLEFDRYTVNLGVLNKDFAPRWQGPKERFLPDLFFPDDTPDNLRNREKLLIEGHRRLVDPLYNMIFVLVAVGAILNGEFSRRMSSSRLIWAVLVMITLEVVAIFLSNSAVKHMELVPLLYGNAFLSILVAMGYVWRGQEFKFKKRSKL